MVRRGRYAEAERNDQLLLDAAREVFATRGRDATVAEIAERAGVGIGSLYRRYPTKDALLQRLCVLAMEQVIEAAERGLLDGDAWSGLVGYVRDCVSFGTGALGPLAGTIETTEPMWKTAHKARHLAAELVARAHAQGSLRRDVASLDIALLVELFSHRSPNRSFEEDRQTRERLLGIAIAGLRTRTDQTYEPLPGRPVTPEEYTAAWRRRSRGR